jgi:hypothetical protein
MRSAAQRVILEDPCEEKAFSSGLRQPADDRVRTSLKQIAMMAAICVFVLSLVYVAHYDMAARRDLRHQALTQELAQVNRESARLQLKLETLTSSGVVTARVKAHGYVFPDAVHSHVEQVAELPWETDARIREDATERPSVIAALREALVGTVRRLAQGPGTSTAMH